EDRIESSKKQKSKEGRNGKKGNANGDHAINVNFDRVYTSGTLAGQPRPPPRDPSVTCTACGTATSGTYCQHTPLRVLVKPSDVGETNHTNKRSSGNRAFIGQWLKAQHRTGLYGTSPLSLADIRTTLANHNGWTITSTPTRPNYNARKNR